MKRYDAIVIGAGIGGLAAALLLAESGRSVVLLEKRNQPGGRIGSSKRDGFTVDFGVHLISRGEKGPLVQLLERCGVEHGIEFTKVRPIQTTGGESFKFPHDLKGRVPDADFEAVVKMVTDVKGMSDEETHAFDGQTLEEFLSTYTTDPFVHACVSQVGFIYCCIPEYRLSAGEFARCLKWEAEARSSGYPTGGCVSIMEAYLAGLGRYGVDVRFGVPVDKVLVEDGRAVGVVAGGEELRSDLVVSNAGIKETVRDLVGEGAFDAEYVRYVDGLEISFVSIIARFALDTVISPEIKMLSGFSSVPVAGVQRQAHAGRDPRGAELVHRGALELRPVGGARGQAARDDDHGRPRRHQGRVLPSYFKRAHQGGRATSRDCGSTRCSWSGCTPPTSRASWARKARRIGIAQQAGQAARRPGLPSRRPSKGSTSWVPRRGARAWARNLP